jgi:hypothetical protein
VSRAHHGARFPHALRPDRDPLESVSQTRGAAISLRHGAYWGGAFTQRSGPDRGACLHVRHPRSAASTRVTMSALTGSTGTATITPLYSGWVIPVFP